MDTMKTCFKCGVKQPRSEFYKHPQMGDGLLGKCKDCTRADVRQHRRSQEYREKVLAYDRLRGNRQKYDSIKRFRSERPDAATAHRKLRWAVTSGKVQRPNRCECCGKSSPLHGHHHDYSKPLAVVWLCAACHRQHHTMMDLIDRAMRDRDEMSA